MPDHHIENYQDPSDSSQNEFEHFPSDPQRHGCVTAWLIFVLIANSIVALIYIFTAQKLAIALNTSSLAIMVLVLAGVINTGSAIMLLLYRKIGFYVFAATSLVTLVLNIYIRISPVKCILGIVGIGVLYAVLQIKRDGVSAWQMLK